MYDAEKLDWHSLKRSAHESPGPDFPATSSIELTRTPSSSSDDDEEILINPSGHPPRENARLFVSTKMSESLKSCDAPREIFIEHSVIAQLDGLIHAIFRVRLEYDWCASSATESYCMEYGRSVSPLSSFRVALIFPIRELSRQCVINCADQKGSALFIVKEAPHDGALLPIELGGRSWYRTLEAMSVLSFSFTGSYLKFGKKGLMSATNYSSQVPFRAFLVSFRQKGFLTRNAKRSEKSFLVGPCQAKQLTRNISLLPFCPARPSPRPPFPRPLPGTEPHLERDSSPASEITPSRRLLSEVEFPRPRAASRWNLEWFAKLAKIFPFPETAAIASEAIADGGYDVGFVGDRSKQVLASNRNLSDEDRDRIRGRLLEETKCDPPRVAGPFSVCPFPNTWCASECRTVPVRTNPAKKYDPSSEKFRLVSNFSKFDPSSINNLCFNPKMVEFSFHSKYLMSILALLGKGAQATLFDIQKAYRWQWTRPADLHLAVYMLGDEEFFVDLAHPFGWITAQYVYQCISAVMKFAALEMGACHAPKGFSSALSVYVDNWALFSSAGDVTHSKRAADLKSWIEKCGPTTHELQSGTKFNSLGWDWNTSKQILSCPDDKLHFIRNKMVDLARRVPYLQSLDLETAESITGFMNWMSVAWREAKLLINPLRKAIKAARRGDKRSIAVTPVCLHAITAAASFLDSWSGRRPFFSDFSPITTWHFLVRSDGSTKYGAGGVMVPGFDCFSHKWDAAESERLWGVSRDTDTAHPLALTSTPALTSDTKGSSDLERESSSIAELLAILYALRTFGLQIRGRRVLLEIDNESMYFALRSWFSDKAYILDLLNEIYGTIFHYNIIIRVEFVEL